MSKAWFKNAVFYGIDIGAFQDSNGDGIGDFQGLIQRLPYLADLGVTCLWLLPFYSSPFRDNGYDVIDYYKVHPAFGTLDDFIEAVGAARSYGIHVIIDLVVAHTSDEHPWFQAARADVKSPYRNYYFWTQKPESITSPAFPGEEDDTWSFDDAAGEYFFHLFYRFQPGLNAFNKEVRTEIIRVMDFWMSHGVSGFRIDAAPHLIERRDNDNDKARYDHEILKELRRHVDGSGKHTVLLGETNVDLDELPAFCGSGDELHLLYNFFLDSYLFLTLAQEQAAPLHYAMAQTPAIPRSCQYVNFLRNLDELNVEHLNEQEREHVFGVFAPDDAMRIYGRGIRRRLASMVSDARKREMAFSLLFTLPGAPLLVYGDEIGMGDDLSLPGRAAVRRAMQWEPDHNEESTPTAEKSPSIICGTHGCDPGNAADQLQNPASFLHAIKRLIACRRRHSLWATGRHTMLHTGDSGIVAMECVDETSRVAALHNLTGKPKQVKIPGRERERWVSVLETKEVHKPTEEGIELEPYGYDWYRVECQ